MDAGRTSNNFIYYLANQAFSAVSNEYLDLDSTVVSLLKSSFIEFENTKKASLHAYLDSSTARELDLDILQETLTHDINEFSRKFFKQHKKEDFIFNLQELRVVLDDVLCRDKILKMAKAKCIMSERYSSSLSSRGQEFLLNYDTLKDQSGYMKVIMQNMQARNSDVNVKMKAQVMTRSISINLITQWNTLSNEDKAILKNQYGISDKKLKELSIPLHERYAKPLMSLKNKVDGMLKEQEQGAKIDKGILKKKLSDLLIYSKDPLAKAFLKEHQHEIDNLVKRASRINVIVDTHGDSFLI